MHRATDNSKMLHAIQRRVGPTGNPNLRDYGIDGVDNIVIDSEVRVGTGISVIDSESRSGGPTDNKSLTDSCPLPHTVEIPELCMSHIKGYIRNPSD